MTDDDIAVTLRAFALQRGPGKTFCPSEVARALSSDWRPLMQRIREIAATQPDLKATQKGRPADPLTASGPIRLGLA